MNSSLNAMKKEFENLLSAWCRSPRRSIVEVERLFDLAEEILRDDPYAARALLYRHGFQTFYLSSNHSPARIGVVGNGCGPHVDGVSNTLHLIAGF